MYYTERTALATGFIVHETAAVMGCSPPSQAHGWKYDWIDRSHGTALRSGFALTVPCCDSEVHSHCVS